MTKNDAFITSSEIKLMTTLFRNKYRVESIRLAGWDYTAQGWYFVTICTKNWRCFFGKLIDEKIQLSKVGEIVAEEWQKIERKRLNINLDEWVVMPDHIIRNERSLNNIRKYIQDNPVKWESDKNNPVNLLKQSEESYGFRSTKT